MKVAWVCDQCNWLQVSDSKLRHQMDTCKCGECAVDLEEGYWRTIGNPREIARFVNDKWEVKE